ncbi:MAG: ABC transporter permease [Bryobacteraceae bacterium]
MNLRYALRTLSRDRGFAAIAILTLALGIGANTVIFSLINGTLLQSVPFPDPERLVTVSEVIPKLYRQYGAFPVNGRHLLEWRKRSKTLEQIAGIDSRRLSLTGAGEPEQIGAAYVSANLFPMLGVQPRLGRNFLEDEDRPQHNQVVILSDSLWRRRFSADPSITGKAIILDGAPHVVVGVMPADFHFFANHDLHAVVSLEPKTDVFRPIAIRGEDIGWQGDYNFMALAKLKRGVSPGQALAELNVIEAGIEKQFSAGEKSELRAVITPLKDQITGQSRRGLLVLLAAVGAVLLIVCVNLANLMLARAMANRRDAAIRTALGASSGDLIRHVLTESLLLSSIGGLLGIAAAYWGTSLLLRIAPVDLPRLHEIHVDGFVLGFGLVLTVLTGLLFGVLPAIRLAKVEPADALRSGGRAASEGARGLRLRSFLVASEVALSAVLLIAAGLLLHSFVRLLQIDKGFETAHVIAADVMLPGARYPDGKARARFYERLLPKARGIPGVRAAGLVSVLPLEGEGWADMISVAGEQKSIMERPLANYRFVSPGYFSAMGIPLLAGRFIEDTDRNSMPAVISQTAAKKVFRGEDPIGKHFRRGDEKEAPFEIVGIVADVRAASLQNAPAMMVYVPYWFRSRMKVSLVARTTLDPAMAAGALRAAVREVDSEAPVGEMRTMEQVVSRSVEPRQFQLVLVLVLVFAFAALTLASLGIYGVVAYMVT